jgi:hypothetical protein
MVGERRKREPELNLPVKKQLGIRRKTRLINEVVEEVFFDDGTLLKHYGITVEAPTEDF